MTTTLEHKLNGLKIDSANINIVYICQCFFLFSFKNGLFAKTGCRPQPQPVFLTKKILFVNSEPVTYFQHHMVATQPTVVYITFPIFQPKKWFLVCGQSIKLLEGAWDPGGTRGQDAGGDAGREWNGEFFVAHFAAFFGALNPHSPMSL